MQCSAVKLKTTAASLDLRNETVFFSVRGNRSGTNIAVGHGDRILLWLGLGTGLCVCVCMREHWPISDRCRGVFIRNGPGGSAECSSTTARGFWDSVNKDYCYWFNFGYIWFFRCRNSFYNPIWALGCICLHDMHHLRLVYHQWDRGVQSPTCITLIKLNICALFVLRMFMPEPNQLKGKTHLLNDIDVHGADNLGFVSQIEKMQLPFREFGMPKGEPSTKLHKLLSIDRSKRAQTNPSQKKQTKSEYICFEIHLRCGCFMWNTHMGQVSSRRCSYLETVSASLAFSFSFFGICYSLSCRFILML